MSGGRTEGKVIYETQSTHKLLAAFSQASMIHVKGEINEATRLRWFHLGDCMLDTALLYMNTRPKGKNLRRII